MIWWLSTACVLMLGLLGQERTIPTLMFKAPLSILFCYVAGVQAVEAGQISFTALTQLGLLLGALGDVLLALPGTGAFLAGLVAFLFGHVMYIGALALLVPPTWQENEVAMQKCGALLTATASFFLFYLRPSLPSNMMIPVCLYVITISVMCCVAFFTEGLRTNVEAAAIIFAISDCFVARNSFVAPSKINRIIGLPLYYYAQFQFAVAVLECVRTDTCPSS